MNHATLATANIRQVTHTTVCNRRLLSASFPISQKPKNAAKGYKTSSSHAPSETSRSKDQTVEIKVHAAQAANSDAIVLSASPKTGAVVVSEFDLLSTTKPVWFLSPLLKTDLLLQNIVPGALEGARGVAPKIYDSIGNFPEAFAHRWHGDQPLEGADFYYDAVALLAFAMNSITPNSDDSGFRSVALDSALRRVSAPPGSSVGWDDIDAGLARQRAGASIYYSGLTGPLLFRSCGERAGGASSQWHVHQGKIITDSD